jgi:hypothetical protein
MTVFEKKWMILHGELNTKAETREFKLTSSEISTKNETCYSRAGCMNDG